LYHIQTKFRDERRPRFGVMRGREFTMKDAYSFDRDRDGAAELPGDVRRLQRIFSRMGLTFRAVAADTGAIGGSASHEFQVIADTGEDAIAYCPDSDYAANVELAEALPLIADSAPPAEPMREDPTPGKARCEDVAELLGLPLARTVKSLVLAVDGRQGGRGDAGRRDLAAAAARRPRAERVKAGKVPGLKGFPLRDRGRDRRALRLPARLPRPDRAARAGPVVADRTCRMSDFVCGANEADFHYTGVNWGRDLPEPAGRGGRRSAQRRRRRPVARRQGDARDPARHRGRPRVLSRHQVLGPR
jgi:prolyl-tRNA synthetase